jgi:hypothetical protein
MNINNILMIYSFIFQVKTSFTKVEHKFTPIKFSQNIKERETVSVLKHFVRMTYGGFISKASLIINLATRWR